MNKVDEERVRTKLDVQCPCSNVQRLVVVSGRGCPRVRGERELDHPKFEKLGLAGHGLLGPEEDVHPSIGRVCPCQRLSSTGGCGGVSE